MDGQQDAKNHHKSNIDRIVYINYFLIGSSVVILLTSLINYIITPSDQPTQPTLLTQSPSTASLASHTQGRSSIKNTQKPKIEKEVERGIQPPDPVKCQEISTYKKFLIELDEKLGISGNPDLKTLIKNKHISSDMNCLISLLEEVNDIVVKANGNKDIKDDYLFILHNLMPTIKLGTKKHVDRKIRKLPSQKINSQIEKSYRELFSKMRQKLKREGPIQSQSNLVSKSSAGVKGILPKEKDFRLFFEEAPKDESRIKDYIEKGLRSFDCEPSKTRLKEIVQLYYSYKRGNTKKTKEPFLKSAIKQLERCLRND